MLQFDNDDNQYYVGEYELHDEPVVPEWIQATLETMIFDDTPTDNPEEICTLCQVNQRKAAFALCGHFCLCLRCKHGMDILRAEILRVNPNYRQPCITCRAPSEAIDIVRDIE
ncbi:uncharacterized protein LOC123261742 [Cotesia glomerata]|uniref:uncharacterized protein LOC123261741 n=1 Tax=Cotesia glomerata TaxID=32391 RepID=UPI001D0199F1|nr:uncharacterized protein LOC123261741 [Cotesia glomerata]XP_044579458.1 uncharacterized protein LOC123261742 [Cotesia glomerata]